MNGCLSITQWIRVFLGYGLISYVMKRDMASPSRLQACQWPESVSAKNHTFWFPMYNVDREAITHIKEFYHHEILHMPRQCCCRGMCKISLCLYIPWVRETYFCTCETLPQDLKATKATQSVTCCVLRTWRPKSLVAWNCAQSSNTIMVHNVLVQDQFSGLTFLITIVLRLPWQAYATISVS